MQQVTDSVFVETGTRGCNPGFVVTSEGVVLIDVPIDINDAKVWADQIASRGAVKFIINTEFHFDHNMTNRFFGGTVISSDITRQLMLDVNNDRWLRLQTSRLYADPLPLPSPEEYRQGTPTVVFSERMTIRLGQHTFHLMRLPGHTPGQTAVYIPEEKVVFAADNVLANGHAHLHDALPLQWLESLDVLKSLDVSVVATGHGGLITRDPQGQLDLLASDIRRRVEAVKEAKAEGLSVNEAVERLREVFPPVPMPATEGFSPTAFDPRRWIVHLYQVTGGNVSW